MILQGASMEASTDLLVHVVSQGYLEGVKYLVEEIGVSLFPEKTTCLADGTLYHTCPEQLQEVRE
jgi:hypothetical protein